MQGNEKEQTQSSFPAVHCKGGCTALQERMQCTAEKELCFCSLSFVSIHLFPFDIYLIKVPVFLPF